MDDITKLEIGAGYLDKESFIRDIVSGRCRGDIIHENRRNVVEVVVCGDLKLAVKRYKPRSLYHKILYSGFRKSKAHKAYVNASELIGAGVSTAAPVAFAERKRWGLFQEGIFISRFVNGGLIIDIYSKGIDNEKKMLLCKAAGEFTCELHSKGFYPQDYNPGNLIYSWNTGEGRFSLTVIDVNRMSTGKTRGVGKSMKCFSELGLRPEEFGPVLEPYSDSRGFDLEDCVYHILKWRRRAVRIKRFKRAVASFFGSGKK